MNLHSRVKCLKNICTNSNSFSILKKNIYDFMKLKFDLLKKHKSTL